MYSLKLEYEIGNIISVFMFFIDDGIVAILSYPRTRNSLDKLFHTHSSNSIRDICVPDGSSVDDKNLRLDLAKNRSVRITDPSSNQCSSESTSAGYILSLLPNNSMAIVPRTPNPSFRLQQVRLILLLTNRRPRRPRPRSPWHNPNKSTNTTSPFPLESTRENLLFTLLSMYSDHRPVCTRVEYSHLH